MDDLRARQEARRRKILQSSEDRLRRIERLKRETCAKGDEEDGDDTRLSKEKADDHGQHLHNHFISSQPSASRVDPTNPIADNASIGHQPPIPNEAGKTENPGSQSRSRMQTQGQENLREDCPQAQDALADQFATFKCAPSEMGRDGWKATQNGPVQQSAVYRDSTGTTRNPLFSNINRLDLNQESTGTPSDRTVPESQTCDGVTSTEESQWGSDELSRQRGEVAGTGGEGRMHGETSWQRVVSLKTLVFVFLALNAWLWIMAVFPSQSIIMLFLVTELLIIYLNVEQPLPQSRAIQLVSALLSLKGVPPERVKQLQRYIGQATGITQDLTTFLFTFLMLHECTDWIWPEAAAQ